MIDGPTVEAEALPVGEELQAAASNAECGSGAVAAVAPAGEGANGANPVPPIQEMIAKARAKAVYEPPEDAKTSPVNVPFPELVPTGGQRNSDPAATTTAAASEAGLRSEEEATTSPPAIAPASVLAAAPAPCDGSTSRALAVAAKGPTHVDDVGEGGGTESAAAAPTDGGQRDASPAASGAATAAADGSNVADSAGGGGGDVEVEGGAGSLEVVDEVPTVDEDDGKERDDAEAKVALAGRAVDRGGGTGYEEEVTANADEPSGGSGSRIDGAPPDPTPANTVADAVAVEREVVEEARPRPKILRTRNTAELAALEAEAAESLLRWERSKADLLAASEEERSARAAHDDVVDRMAEVDLAAPSRWADMYRLLLAYREGKGHANVPYGHVDAETGLDLGRWAANQRVFRGMADRDNGAAGSKKKRPHIKPHRVRMLDMLGFCWNFRDAAWDRNLAALAEFRRVFGHTAVPRDWEDRRLWSWVDQTRNHYRRYKANKPTSLTAERVKRLDALGFIWEIGAYTKFLASREPPYTLTAKPKKKAATTKKKAKGEQDGEGTNGLEVVRHAYDDGGETADDKRRSSSSCELLPPKRRRDSPGVSIDDESGKKEPPPLLTAARSLSDAGLTYSDIERDWEILFAELAKHIQFHGREATAELRAFAAWNRAEYSRVDGGGGDDNGNGKRAVPHRLTAERVARLEALGFDLSLPRGAGHAPNTAMQRAGSSSARGHAPTPQNDVALWFDDMYEQMSEYRKEHGHVQFHRRASRQSGSAELRDFASWCRKEYKGMRAGERGSCMTEDRAARLEVLGFLFVNAPRKRKIAEDEEVPSTNETEEA